MPVSEVRIRYYIRLQASDKPGVLAAVSGILAKAGISIASVTQKETAQESVPVVILTHAALEANMQMALKEMSQLGEIVEPPVLFRIEDLP